MPKPTVVLYARIDPELFELIKAEADKEFRSTTKQIEFILRKYFNYKQGGEVGK